MKKKSSLQRTSLILNKDYFKDAFFFPFRKKCSGFSQGFTLIEVMIAISILALMTVLLYASMTETVKTNQSTEDRDELMHQASLALGRMARDLEMSFLIVSPDFLGNDGRKKTVFKGDQDRVNFATFSIERYFAESQENNYGEVGYFLEKDPDKNDTNILKRREQRLLDDRPEEGGKVEEMVGSVSDLRFEYYDATKKDWSKSWDSSQLEFSNHLPRMVKITLKLKDPDSEEEIELATYANVKLHAAPLAY